MRKVSKLLSAVLAVGAVTYLTSCDPGEIINPARPTISFADESGNTLTSLDGIPGDEQTIVVTVEAEGGFNRLAWSLWIGTDSTFVDERSRGTSIDSVATFTLTYTHVDSLVGQAPFMEFLAVDEEGQTATGTLNINTTEPPNPVTSYTAFLLAAPTDDQTSETFFSTIDGETYSMGAVLGTTEPVSAEIDFGYFYGQTSNATLASPAEYPFAYGQANWGTRNNTLFRTTSLDATAFDNIGANDGDDIAAAYEAGTAVTSGNGEQARNLAVGQVLAFVTDADKASNGGKFGLIKVVSITGTSGSDGRIEIEVKIEQAD